MSGEGVGYELRDMGDRWAAIRIDAGREVELESWPRDADPLRPDGYGLLTQLGAAVERRWGRPPVWVGTSTGWEAM